MALNSNYTALVDVKISDARLQAQLKNLGNKEVVIRTKLDQNVAKQLNAVNSALKTAGDNASKFSSNTESAMTKVSTSVQKASKHTKTLGEDFLSTAGKVAKFGAITAMLGLFTTAVSEAVKSVKDMDSAMVEFNKVSNISEGSLDNYVKKLGEIGTEVGRTTTEMISASTEFIKAGYNEQQSAQLAKTASLFQNIADSELSASDASSIIIANLKAFNMTAEESTKIVDVINEVDILAFPFGNIWVIKDNYIGQTLGIEETEQRLG